MAYCNLDKAFYDLDNNYGFPTVERFTDEIDVKHWIAFNLTKHYKMNVYRKEVGIHFFIDDYQFECLWGNPNKYIDNFKKLGMLTMPDYSMFIDFPNAINIYNKYRNHWLAKFYQERGIKVLPTLLWSDEESLNWAFDGYEKGGIYCLPRIGVANVEEWNDNFRKGLFEAERVLEPKKLIIFQKNPNRLEIPLDCDYEVIDVGFNHTLDTRKNIRENGIDNISNENEKVGE